MSAQIHRDAGTTTTGAHPHALVGPALAAPAPVGGRRAWLMWAVAATVYPLAMFHRMSLGVAALQAQQRFHVGPGALATFSVLQLVIYLLMQVPAGVLADRVGPRRMLAFGVTGMAVGELMFAAAHSLPVGLAARALVGLGDACVFLNVLRLGQNWFPARRYAFVSALTGLAGAAGQLVTTVPLTAALNTFGWGATFAVSGAVTLLMSVVAAALLRDGPQPAVRTSPRLPIARAVRAAARRHGTRMGFFTHFTLMGPFVVLSALWGFPYLVQAQHLSHAAASGVLSLLVVVFAATSPVVGGAVARLPHLRDLVARAAASALLLAWMALLGWPGRAPLVVVIVAFSVTAAGAAVSMLAFDMARADSPASYGGTATGLTNCGGFLAAGVAELAVGLLLAALGAPTAAHYRVALLPILVLVGVGTAVLWRMRLAPASARDAYPVT